MIVSGGGLSKDGTRWISCRPKFFVHVDVLSALFRGRFLAMLAQAHAESRPHGVPTIDLHTREKSP